MSGPQPGPYPQYPGGGGMPVTPARPPLPDTVRYAFYLMLAGAALQVIGIVATLVQIDAIRDSVEEGLRDNPGTTTDVDTFVNALVGVSVGFGLIVVALWIWMAFANRAGQNWARIVASVFFGISVVITLFGLAASASGSTASMGSAGTALSTVISVLGLLVGLAVIIMLWNGRSTPYFKPEEPTGYGYQPPAQPYGSQPYGTQPPASPPPGQPYGTPPPGPQPPNQPPPPEGGPGGMTPPQ